jgi:hypothetical protein
MTMKRVPLPSPYRGVVSDTTVPLDPSAFTDMVNFLCRKGRIQTRPRMGGFGVPPDDAIIRNVESFADAENNWHTLCLTTKHAYAITAGAVFNELTLPVGIPTLLGQQPALGTSLPFGTAAILNRIYFCNGSVPLLYTDGEVSVKLAGDVQGSGRFLTQNAYSLIMAVTAEPAPGTVGSLLFPNRVRWSAAGLPDEWDPTIDFTAGLNDLVDVPDIITGLATLGRNTYVFRTNGITVMYPTGIGTSAFAFEPYSFSPKGVGNKYPYSLATFNNRSVFVASNEIYVFDGTNMDVIGMGNKKAIYKDLAQNTGDVVRGMIVPNLGVDYDFLSYWLTIPGPDVTWVYSFDDRTWQKVVSSVGGLTAINSDVVLE